MGAKEEPNGLSLVFSALFASSLHYFFIWLGGIYWFYGNLKYTAFAIVSMCISIIFLVRGEKDLYVVFAIASSIHVFFKILNEKVTIFDAVNRIVKKHEENKLSRERAIQREELARKRKEKTEMKKQYDAEVKEKLYRGKVANCQNCDYRWNIRQMHSIPANCPKCHKQNIIIVNPFD